MTKNILKPEYSQIIDYQIDFSNKLSESLDTDTPTLLDELATLGLVLMPSTMLLLGEKKTNWASLAYFRVLGMSDSKISENFSASSGR